MRNYTPRRASKARWLQDAPDYILDCFDSKDGGEQYTVVFTKEFSSMTGEFKDTWVSFLGMSGAPTHPQGISMWGEMKAYEMAAYRYRVGKQRVRWLDLPEHIRNHVIARATQD